ncbi:type I-F CRISPR-associated protein Csy2 [bacterium (Candidatus Blackallbacteria) CG17_big_fil_post_rev_8_21_14_2_50_48_46]|uniref:Type I-F CRISPR-associated protein Csy2 n=1 Tax=bacterium (Candidatus Blackallbacteria) CG17_big_fil_post_rev_8_21_14_2_50_48_46 TaxID=2014261 RepID=A0A2M7G8W8_9BACT|nr:MAG: type I-F CRISPR-associated protein Csy2 [bacterium (Candidatus Blackallbacteria) CG18_big_fil_WC_8_21_14_2_50_49_26]PIW18549.1 MAG: type I-F CRISPR-associated protein Csy2 [bacterium (Candidatus Blackallbacteria) CG17_big_fil_post_rev_8_21_14_2_50_48_46]PIW46466.1 MAG: type I-F CRISPR-associated protein Csy2 [bacterium (Candidatus Blackallbacteria) CG13_big_fil_rev_8_21_14_2_50_49_14]
MRRVFLIPQISIQNANALSSPYTIGFPAMTAWLGAVHALQRQMNQNGYAKLRFEKVAVCCHELNLQTYKGLGDFDASIIGTGNPLNREGKRPSFIEEARCHLRVSLVVEYSGLSLLEQEDNQWLDLLSELLHSGLKLAGGDILNFKPLHAMTIHTEEELRKLTRRLMPGYILMERRELMQEAMNSGQDALTAMLDYLKIQNRSQENDAGQVVWSAQRKHSGWIVPIAVGFHGLTPLAPAKHQRDSHTPHRFAESLVTLGEFVMPYRIQSLDEMFWYYQTDLEQNLYLCQQTKSGRE